MTGKSRTMSQSELTAEAWLLLKRNQTAKLNCIDGNS